ncbi:prostaglandin E synthase 2-like [Branchiostoma floridae x Branchiostoma belcheri]
MAASVWNSCRSVGQKFVFAPLLRNCSQCGVSQGSKTTLRPLRDAGIQRRELFSHANSSRTGGRWLSVGLGVAGLTAVSGAGYVTYRYRQAMSTTAEGPVTTAQCQSSPDLPPMKVTLYQYLTCPFCCKTRAFLEYYGIDFQVVEVNPLSRREISWSDYKKVPIVIVEMDGKDEKQQLNDSSVIISVLKTFMVNTHKDLDKVVSYYPIMVTQDTDGKEVREIANRHWVMVDLETMSEEYGKRRRSEVKWRKWVDDHFVHMLAPNIYRSQAEALQAFDYITNVQNFGPWEKWAAKYGGSAIMWTIAKRLKSKYQLKDDVRESLYDAANEWLKGVGKKRFMGGSQPNLADLAVYGVLSSIEDFDTFKDLMENTKMRPWYERTKKAVKSHAGANTTHVHAP